MSDSMKPNSTYVPVPVELDRAVARSLAAVDTITPLQGGVAGNLCRRHASLLGPDTLRKCGLVNMTHDENQTKHK